MLIVYTLTEEKLKSKNHCLEELILQMANGDVNAMGEFYELAKNDVYAYALSKTANVTEAEDITQDTFVQIWKNAKLYQAMGKPLAWVFTIELNRIRRMYDTNKRFRPLDECVREEKSQTDFSQNVENSEFISQVMAVLSEEEREIIILHVVSGLKHREIANLIQKPLSTVLSKYNRALKKLRLQIKQKGE